jgi:hypothetical protein
VARALPVPAAARRGLPGGRCTWPSVRIDVEPDDGAAGERPHGVIETLLFVGDRYEARVALGGAQRIILLLPRTREWKEGQAIALGFPPTAVSVWPA